MSENEIYTVVCGLYLGGFALTGLVSAENHKWSEVMSYAILWPVWGVVFFIKGTISNIVRMFK